MAAGARPVFLCSNAFNPCAVVSEPKFNTGSINLANCKPTPLAASKPPVLPFIASAIETPAPTNNPTSAPSYSAL